MHYSFVLKPLFVLVLLTCGVFTSRMEAMSPGPVCFVLDTVDVSICSGQIYQVGNNSYSVTGAYTDTFLSAGGCDSIVLTNLTVDTVIYQTFTLTGCTHVTFDSSVYTVSTVVYRNIQNVLGCDSISQTYNINVTANSYYGQSFTICQGQSIRVGAITYSSSGFYVDTLFNAAVGGCDSIVHTLLTVISPYDAFLVISDTCTGVYNGRTYSSGAVFNDTIVSTVTGCDSVYLNVTINIVPPPVTIRDTSVRLCPGQSYFAGGHYQTQPGSYHDTIYTAVGGCDSIYITTDLSVLHPQYFSQSFDTCDPVTINGVLYASDTIFADTILSSLGCDSLIYTDSVHIKAASITILSTALLPIPEGDSTQLIINPDGNYQDIVWSPNQWITNIYLPAPYVLPDVSTAYTVTAVDSNHCTISASIIVTVTPSKEADYVMPNAFTPNGDGRNDSFGPILSPGAQVQVFHIYDRWGQMVYDKDVTDTIMWDGMYDNSRQAAGTYLYFITVISANGTVTSREGSFELFR